MSFSFSKKGGINEWYDDKVNRAANEETIRILTKACILVLRTIKESMREEKMGKEYRKPAAWSIRKNKKTGKTKLVQRKGAVWTASAPGEAPSARHTGNLMSSLDFEIGDQVIEGQRILIGRVGTLGEGKFGDPTYALHLALGTKNMQPRPYLRPALAFHAAEIAHMFDSRKL